MKSHRGISAVVGTVFLIAVVVGSLSYVSYSLELMGNFSESLIVEENRQKDKQAEAFEISSIDVTGANKLDGVVKNTGEIPLKLTTLWIDEQGVNDVVQKYTLDAEIAPGGTVDLQSLVDVDMQADKGYNMKVVSSRGEVSSFYVNSLADENVYMSLIATPTVIPSTFSTNLIFTVVNNMSNGNYLYNLTPVMNDTAQTLGVTSAGLSYEQLSDATPPSYESLGPGEVAVFTYEYELTGETDGDIQHFNVTLANANKGNEALASATIKTVPLATDAGSALTSFGLSDTSTAQADVLYFHTSGNIITPNGEYPMDGTSPNTAGVTVSPNGNTIEFISAQMISETTVPPGQWTAALNYFSSPVPLNIPDPDFAVMLNKVDCGDNDEVCEMINLFDPDKSWKEQDSKPDFISSGGPDGDGYFHFDSNEWFRDDFDVDNGFVDDFVEPGYYPDSDSVWIKLDTGFSGTETIFRFGNDWVSGDDCLELDVHSGGIVRYRIASYDCSSIVECDSDEELDDGTWHHIVTVRDAPHSGRMYVDGKLQSDICSGAGAGSDGHIDIDWIGIGARGENNNDDDGYNDHLNGGISSWLHWNDYEISSAQAQDLYYTNYGSNGTRLYMTVEIVDSLGTTVEHTIIDNEKLELAFHDPSYGNTNGMDNPWHGLHTDNDTDAKYQQGNMTATDLIGYTLDVGERLKLTLDWNDEDEHNLPVNIMWDDNSGWSLPGGPSYMQTPEPSPRWPTFLSFDYEDEINYLAYNEGPGGIWFVYSGTRLVLTTVDGENSYAAVPYTVNQTTQPTPISAYSEITPTQDSIYIPAENYAELDFYMLQSPPTADNNPPLVNKVPNCDYEAAIYLQGYDETGETFKKTVDLGLIHITGNPTYSCP